MFSEVVIPTHVVMLAALIGLIVRGRWRLSLVFTAYIPLGMAANGLLLLWPALWGQAFYMASQMAFDILKLALVFETGWRTFRLFPGARAAARKVAAVILTVTAAAALLAPLGASHRDPYVIAVTLVHPRVEGGTLWLMAAVLVVAHWYRAPVHPFVSALLTGFVVYLACFGGLLSLMNTYGFEEFRPYAMALEPLAFLLAACWWATAAWKPHTEASVGYATTLRRLEVEFGGDFLPASHR